MIAKLTVPVSAMSKYEHKLKGIVSQDGVSAVAIDG
jgi:hypothetical protein